MSDEMPQNANDAWWGWMRKHKPKATPQEQSLLWNFWCTAWTGGRMQERHEPKDKPKDKSDGQAQEPKAVPSGEHRPSP